MVPTAKQPSADAADDLDDLDDILDEFNKPAEAEASNKQEPSTAQVAAGEGTRATQAAGPGAAASAAAAGADSNSDKDEEDDELKERFSRELAQGMEALMRGADPELAAAAAAAGGSPGAGGAGAGLPGAAGAGGSNGATAGDGSNLFDEEQMMKQFEQMMADMGLGGTGSGGLGAGPSSAPSAPSASSSSQKPQQPANFQDAIRSTMSRLRESDQTATSSAGQSGEMDFEKLFAAMSNSEGGEGGEEGIANMLESMMSELMSKEVLYDPLKELRDKYPGYLAKPPATLSDSDRTRYERQHQIVGEVIKIFDDPKFDNGSDAEKQALKSRVQTLMNEMQDSGAPPQKIVGDLPPELENLPGLGGDENCCVM